LQEADSGMLSPAARVFVHILSVLVV